MPRLRVRVRVRGVRGVRVRVTGLEQLGEVLTVRRLQAWSLAGLHRDRHTVAARRKPSGQV